MVISLITLNALVTEGLKGNLSFVKIRVGGVVLPPKSSKTSGVWIGHRIGYGSTLFHLSRPQRILPLAQTNQSPFRAPIPAADAAAGVGEGTGRLALQYGQRRRGKRVSRWSSGSSDNCGNGPKNVRGEKRSRTNDRPDKCEAEC